MKFTTKLLLTLILAFVTSYFTGFILVTVAVVTLNIVFNSKLLTALLSGFLGTGIIWFAFSWYFSANNGLLIHERIAELMTVSPVSLNIITGITGGVLGLLSAWLGFSLRNLIGSVYKSSF